jgi:hypothetical protein
MTALLTQKFSFCFFIKAIYFIATTAMPYDSKQLNQIFTHQSQILYKA